MKYCRAVLEIVPRNLVFEELDFDTSIHFTRSTVDSDPESRTVNYVKSLNTYMKEKKANEFKVRSDTKNIELTKAIDGL